jgi:diguanylate cyclase (GGDEF)-like protein
MKIVIKPDLRFDNKTEKAYQTWLDSDSRHFIRLSLGFGVIAYLFNHIADYSIAGADYEALFLVRILAASTLALLLGVMTLFKEVSPTPIVIFTAIVLSVANTSIAHNMPESGAFFLAASQTLIALFLTVVVLRFHDLIVVAAILFVIPTAFAALIDGNSIFRFMEGAILATASASMVFIGHFAQQSRRTIFKLSKDLHHAATHDSLTGAKNRMQMMNSLDQEIKRSKLFKNPIAVLSIDVDHFKSINDTYGHSGGDEVLKALTDGVEGKIRSTDLFGRVGGEEFLVVLPETNLTKAKDMAQRLRHVVEEMHISCYGQSIACTISIGVAEMQESDDMAKLLVRADNALYAAKRKGRNRVETENLSHENRVSKLKEPKPNATKVETIALNSSAIQMSS